MKVISLKAKSSSGDYYEVEFKISEVIKVACNCSAGIFGKLCKHKTNLLTGDPNFLYDTIEEPKLNDIFEIVKRSQYFSLSNEYQSSKKAIETAKKNEKKIKNKIELILKEGIPLISKS